MVHTPHKAHESTFKTNTRHSSRYTKSDVPINLIEIVTCAGAICPFSFYHPRERVHSEKATSAATTTAATNTKDQDCVCLKTSRRNKKKTKIEE